MSQPLLSVTNNLSIVWGIVLAFITILDWNTLNRDPANEDILTPFITREITLLVPESENDIPVASEAGKASSSIRWSLILTGLYSCSISLGQFCCSIHLVR